MSDLPDAEWALRVRVDVNARMPFFEALQNGRRPSAVAERAVQHVGGFRLNR